MLFDEAGPNKCLIRWTTNRTTQGEDLFICSHRNGDGKLFSPVDGQAVYFYGGHGNVIGAEETYTIMRGSFPKGNSVAGPGGVWDYFITEFPAD